MPRLPIRRIVALAGILVVVSLVVLAVVVLLPAYTPGIRGPRAIASLETVTLGGWEQSILIRGRDREAPVLLFLHGGPGMPAMYLHHRFGSFVEDNFVVVHWDQRGAGKSYSEALPRDTLRVSRMLADAEELIGHLRERFGRERIVLVGHSWGSYLGALLAERHPEWLHAWVGVGQVTDPEAERLRADAFIRERAREEGLEEALEQMRTAPDAHRERWLFRFGGELHGSTSFLPLVVAGLLAPEYSFGEVPKVAEGSQVSSRHMEWDVRGGSLWTPEEGGVSRFEVPVWLLQGRYDMVSPSPLVAEYFDAIRAPGKRLVWFEESAHFPFFEEPERFGEALARLRRELLGG